MSVGKSGNEARILDGVKDQDDGYWIRFGTATRSVWFGLEELHHAPSRVFGRLAAPGTALLTPAAQTRFKEGIERHTEYRDALVAGHPGWVGDHYVYGDGTVQRSPSDDREIIVAFERDARFAERGSLSAWKDTICPLVEGQRLPTFALAFAFVGPLLRFAPPDYVNPQVEFVGRPECGKSTILVAAQSVWAGNPACDVGACETWDLTLASLDGFKLSRADGFLPLDEGNLAGSTTRQQKEIITATVFKLAGTGRRKRFLDIRPGHQTRVAIMSTTNRSLSEHVSSHGDVAGALRSRVLTIRIDDHCAYGIFSSLPNSCSTSRGASERLRKAANENFSGAAREFIKHLVREVSRDEAAFKRKLETGLNNYLKRAQRGESARIGKTFALTAVAGHLACDWGVLPFKPGFVVKAIRELHGSIGHSGEAGGQPAIERIRSYVERHEGDVIENPEAPLDEESFETAYGFLRRSRYWDEILIPSGRFKGEFRDYRELARELADGGFLKFETGQQRKLTIKTPKAFCSSGRVYCILLPR